MKECSVCGSEIPASERSRRLQVRVFTDEGMERPVACRSCWRGDPIFWCPVCRSAHQDSSWGSTASGNPQPCREHSVSEDEPLMDCVICEEPFNLSDGVVTEGMRVFCPDHRPRWTCIAPYCGARIHPDDPEVNRPRETCARHGQVRRPPSWFPVRNPHSWDYDPDCTCQACSYLSGAGPEWPDDGNPPTADIICGGCESQVAHQDTEFVESEESDYCHSCLAARFDTCDDCETRRDTDHLHQAEQRPGVYCDSCMEDRGTYWFCNIRCQQWFINDHSCNCNGVYPHNYHPPQESLTFHTATDERVTESERKDIPFMGFELELERLEGGGNPKREGALMLNDIPWAYPVHDGSLSGDRPDGSGGDYGFEIVTHPFTYLWFQEHWPDIEGLLRQYAMHGFRSWEGGKCGMHVHISRAPMSDAHEMKFINFLYGSTNLALCVGQRGYKSRGVQKYAPFDKEPRAKLMQKVKRGINPGVSGHYAAINSSKAHTLEARWFRGTLNPDSFRKNIEFVHSVWEFTRKFGHTSSNEINYIEWLRGTPERRRYAVLLEYLEKNYVTRR